MGKWTHIKELNLKKNNLYKESLKKIKKHVSLQIFYKMNDDYPKKIESTLKEIL